MNKWWIDARKREIKRAREERGKSRQEFERQFHQIHVECALELGEYYGHCALTLAPRHEELRRGLCLDCYGPADLLRLMLWIWSPRDDQVKTNILVHEIARARNIGILNIEKELKGFHWAEDRAWFDGRTWVPQTDREKAALARAKERIDGGFRFLWREWWRLYRQRDDLGNPRMSNPLRYLIFLAQNCPDQCRWAFGEGSLI